MELFIQIRDGQPYEHPILGDNFREAFPHIDVGDLPPEFARFVRMEMPPPDGVYRVVVDNYVWDGDVVKDNWLIRDMTEEEKQEKIALAMQTKPEGDQWVFDTEKCGWVNLEPDAGHSPVTIGVSRV